MGKKNIGRDHLLCIPSRDVGGRLDDALSNAHLLQVDVVVDQFVDIVT